MLSVALAVVWTWIGCGLVSLIFQLDYGRSSCWQRDVGDWAVVIFTLPLVAVLLVADLIGALFSKESANG